VKSQGERNKRPPPHQPEQQSEFISLVVREKYAFLKKQENQGQDKKEPRMHPLCQIGEVNAFPSLVNTSNLKVLFETNRRKMFLTAASGSSVF
jgi:hypothetical protein